MRYIKLYDNFTYDKETETLIDVDSEKEITNKTIDDVLKDDFFDDEKDSDVKKDNRGVYHITDWKIY